MDSYEFSQSSTLTLPLVEKDRCIGLESTKFFFFFESQGNFSEYDIL